MIRCTLGALREVDGYSALASGAETGLAGQGWNRALYIRLAGQECMVGTSRLALSERLGARGLSFTCAPDVTAASLPTISHPVT
ncbi:hypothetical protein M8818_005429 [Zalaria obscura]|uniref:Uncharacterized protein n=1 Tax=Zalaria obscura TaxID=2024903 RepID=A0ACC3S8C5_9PEZI